MFANNKISLSEQEEEELTDIKSSRIPLLLRNGLLIIGFSVLVTLCIASIGSW